MPRAWISTMSGLPESVPMLTAPYIADIAQQMTNLPWYLLPLYPHPSFPPVAQNYECPALAPVLTKVSGGSLSRVYGLLPILSVITLALLNGHAFIIDVAYQAITSIRILSSGSVANSPGHIAMPWYSSLLVCSHCKASCTADCRTQNIQDSQLVGKDLFPINMMAIILLNVLTGCSESFPSNMPATPSVFTS